MLLRWETKIRKKTLVKPVHPLEVPLVVLPHHKLLLVEAVVTPVVTSNKSSWFFAVTQQSVSLV